MLPLTTLLLFVGCPAGCTAPSPQPDFHSALPAEKIAAIRQAARAGNCNALPDLVTQLGSVDPVVRMMAIRALRDLTEQTHGYRYDAPLLKRNAAIQRWVQAVERQQPAPNADAPATERNRPTADQAEE